MLIIDFDGVNINCANFTTESILDHLQDFMCGCLSTDDFISRDRWRTILMIHRL